MRIVGLCIQPNYHPFRAFKISSASPLKTYLFDELNAYSLRVSNTHPFRPSQIPTLSRLTSHPDVAITELFVLLFVLIFIINWINDCTNCYVNYVQIYKCIQTSFTMRHFFVNGYLIGCFTHHLLNFVTYLLHDDVIYSTCQSLAYEYAIEQVNRWENPENESDQDIASFFVSNEDGRSCYNVKLSHDVACGCKLEGNCTYCRRQQHIV